MNRIFRFSRAAAALLALAFAVPAIAAEHHHGAQDHATLTLNDGRKWQTDEPLRRNMGEIRTLLAGKLERIHQGRLSGEEYRALGAEIAQRVETIVAQCKLDPRADAVLHPIIADILAGTEAMQGKGKTAPAAGAHRIVHALHSYETYFDHPGWKTLK